MLITRRPDVSEATGRSIPLKIAAPTLTTSRNRRHYLHTIVVVTLVAATLLAAWHGSQVVSKGDFAAELPASPAQKVISSKSFRGGYLHATVLLTTEMGRGPVDVLAASSSPQIPTVEQPVQAVETPEPAEETEETLPEPEDVYFTYVVQRGDTVASIATRFGLEMETLLWNNSHLQLDPDLLLIGEELTIPTRDGILYTVRLGDTLLDVADIYQTDVEDIAGLTANQVNDPDSVLEGMVLLLPGAVPPPPPPPAATSQSFFAAGVPEETPAASYAASAAFAGFIWPVVGPIGDYFGTPRGAGTYHSGLDICAATGTPIAAAAGGQVVLVSAGGGYGNYVVVRHDNGLETLYAHLSEVWVAQGQWVVQGEAVGAAGATGWATGPHLHLEVRQSGVAVDPLIYLP